MSPKINLNDAYKRFTLDQDKIISPEEVLHFSSSNLELSNLNDAAVSIPLVMSLASSCRKPVITALTVPPLSTTPNVSVLLVQLAEELYSLEADVSNAVRAPPDTLKPYPVKSEIVSPAMTSEEMFAVLA